MGPYNEFALLKAVHTTAGRRPAYDSLRQAMWALMRRQDDLAVQPELMLVGAVGGNEAGARAAIEIGRPLGFPKEWAVITFGGAMRSGEDLLHGDRWSASARSVEAHAGEPVLTADISLRSALPRNAMRAAWDIYRAGSELTALAPLFPPGWIARGVNRLVDNGMRPLMRPDFPVVTALGDDNDLRIDMGGSYSEVPNMLQIDRRDRISIGGWRGRTWDDANQPEWSYGVAAPIETWADFRVIPRHTGGDFVERLVSASRAWDAYERTADAQRGGPRVHGHGAMEAAVLAHFQGLMAPSGSLD